MAAGGEGGAVQDEVGWVFGCSETQHVTDRIKRAKRAR